MKEEIEVRIELVEDESKENGIDYAKVRKVIKDDQEKLLSRNDILEKQGYKEDNSLKRMDDIEIKKLRAISIALSNISLQNLRAIFIFPILQQPYIKIE
jgi:hypothetical protein